MRYFAPVLSFLALGLVLSLLGAPLFLVIAFPASAAHFTAIAKTLIPWLSVVLLLLVFHEGVREVFRALAGALNRLKKLGGGGVTSEFEGQQFDVAPLTSDQLTKLAEYVQSLTDAKEGETLWAWHFFIKYVVATIYGSQVQLLLSLHNEGTQKPGKLRRYYEFFLEREPDSSQYKFESYVQYLISNLLIRLDVESHQYEITAQGEKFLEVLDEYGSAWNMFRG